MSIQYISLLIVVPEKGVILYSFLLMAIVEVIKYILLPKMKGRDNNGGKFLNYRINKEVSQYKIRDKESARTAKLT